MRMIVRGLMFFFSIVLSSYTLFEVNTGEQGCYYEGISAIPSVNGGWLVSGAYNCGSTPATWKSCLVTLDAQGDTVSIAKDLPFNGIMRSAADGSLIFAGGNHAGFVYDTARIFKTDLAGTLLWKKSLFEEYCHHLITDILILEDGFVITGNHAQASCTSPVYDAYVAKLDAAGEVVWQYEVTEAGNDQLHAVRKTKDGNIAAFGWTENKSSADDADYLLIKLDSNGNKIWSEKFGDDSDNYGYGMDITSDNGFIVNGHSAFMNVMRINENGKLLWSKNLAESCGGRYFKAHTTLDGGFIFLGMEKVSTQCLSTLIKTNHAGEISWKKNFAGVLRDVKEHSPGRFVLTGYKSYLPKLYVVAFDTTVLNNDENPGRVIDHQREPLFANDENVIHEDTLTAGDLSVGIQAKRPVVYPNPAESIVYIDFENAAGKLYQLEIFDASGKLVMKEDSSAVKITISGDAIAKGVYTYRLSGAGNIYFGKILFQ